MPSLPIAYRLYLPREWAEDAARRRKARVPDEIEFKTKPEIALEQIRAAREAGVPIGVVLIDSGYGRTQSYAPGSSEKTFTPLNITMSLLVSRSFTALGMASPP